MEPQEKQEWVSDLKAIAETIALIKVRFETVSTSGLPGSERVAKAQSLYHKLNDAELALRADIALLKDEETVPT
jgi:hypothetical protein